MAALWNRIDYRVRQMAPFQHLSTDSPFADLESDYLSMDYICPPLPEILWHSFKRRDIFVTASSLVAILLTLSTVASTGLLTPLEVPVTLEEVPSLVDRQYLPNLTYSYNTPLPVQIVSAVNTHNLSYSEGTTPNLTYTTFRPLNAMPDGSLYKAEVDTLFTDLKCEEAEFNVNAMDFSWSYDCTSDSKAPSSNLSVSLSVEGCEIGIVVMESILATGTRVWSSILRY